jgi:protein-disulfide isomerase
LKTSLKTTLLLCGSIFALGLTAATTLKAEENKTIGNMTESELSEFITDYLMDNPAVIFASVEQHNKNVEAERAATVQEKLKDYMEAAEAETKTVVGNPDADIVIVEFFDYNCGYCKRALDDVTKTLENDRNVRFVFKELPILSAASTTASRYAQAAAEQSSELYFKYHVALMQHRGPKDEASLERVAKDIGLDVDLLKKDAKSDKITDILVGNKKMADDLGIRGTPAFIIGDFISPGYMGYDGLTDVIKEQRNEKKK